MLSCGVLYMPTSELESGWAEDGADGTFGFAVDLRSVKVPLSGLASLRALVHNRQFAALDENACHDVSSRRSATRCEALRPKM